LEVESRDLFHEDFDVFVTAQNRTNGRGNFAGGKSCGRNLIEQRLKGVVILAIDDRDLDRGVSQTLRGIQAAEAGAHDHNARLFFRGHLAV